SATSRPTNAKMRTIAVLPTAEMVGSSGQRKYSVLMNHMPLTTSTTSGTSLAIVTVSTRPTPRRTPRTLIAASSANKAAINTPRPIVVVAGGHIAPTEPANAIGADDTANWAIK